MQRRYRHLALSALAAVAMGGNPAAGDERRPNIVLILADDVALMDFGAYGGEARTPWSRTTGAARSSSSTRSGMARSPRGTGVHRAVLGLADDGTPMTLVFLDDLSALSGMAEPRYGVALGYEPRDTLATVSGGQQYWREVNGRNARGFHALRRR